MMKNLLKSIMAGIMSLSVMGAVAFAEVPEKVEIKFTVGDETLTINGGAVTVEKPYVVGDGVTLVPLRVITEAFGAEVLWEQETKSITLNYPDVNIILGIGDSVAEVNSMAETLLAPPELTENGVTMVPLRFISETFGAEVSYNSETKEITVLKQSAKEEQTTVIGAADEARVGDSYYGWSIENATDFTVADRSFDGTSTDFVRDSLNDFTVYVSEIEEDYDFDRDFIEYKSSFEEYTLVKAQKDVSDEHNKKMYLQAKDKNEFFNIIVWVTDKYIYEVYGFFDNTDQKTREECIRIMSTFSASFDAKDTYDMSGVENGMRRYTNKDAGIAVDVPQEYLMVSDPDSANSFMFASSSDDDVVSNIIIEIYSKSDVGGAEELAKRDQKNNKEALNKDITKNFTEVKECEYDGKKGYEYSYEVMGTKAADKAVRDVFFEVGSYVYNIGVSAKTPDDDALPTIDAIIRSLEITEADEEVLGVLIRNEPEREGTYVSKGDGWSINVPNSYSEMGSTYIDGISGTVVTVQVVPANGVTASDLKNQLIEIENNTVYDKDTSVVERVKDVTLGNARYSRNVMARYSDGVMMYTNMYATVYRGKSVIILAMTPQLTYTDKVYTQIEKIASSLKVGE